MFPYTIRLVTFILNQEGFDTVLSIEKWIMFLQAFLAMIGIFKHKYQPFSFYVGTLANSENPDEMPHKAAFHHGLHR